MKWISVAAALVGAMKLIEPTVLITDEESARRMIELTAGATARQ